MKIIMALLLGSIISCGITGVKSAPKHNAVNMQLVDQIKTTSNGHTVETTIYVDTNTNILYMQINGGLTPVINSDGTYKTLEEKNK